MAQKKQSQWNEQWSMLQDNELFLFEDWILPYTLKDFENKDVLECGCGGGQHSNFMAKHAKSVTAVDLNTVNIAKERNKENKNVTFIEADLAKMNLKKKFDIVISIGVVHHTDSPEKTVANLKEHLKKGGILILWVYSEENNWMVRKIVEPIRKACLEKVSRKSLLTISNITTFFLYAPIYTLYYLPFKFLPYYEYFKNFRKLSFRRNSLNVFDKLNAPQTDFINYKRACKFVEGMQNANIESYKNVSWRISGVQK